MNIYRLITHVTNEVGFEALCSLAGTWKNKFDFCLVVLAFNVIILGTVKVWISISYIYFVFDIVYAVRSCSMEDSRWDAVGRAINISWRSQAFPVVLSVDHVVWRLSSIRFKALAVAIFWIYSVKWYLNEALDIIFNYLFLDWVS